MQKRKPLQRRRSPRFQSPPPIHRRNLQGRRRRNSKKRSRQLQREPFKKNLNPKLLLSSPHTRRPPLRPLDPPLPRSHQVSYSQEGIIKKFVPSIHFLSFYFPFNSIIKVSQTQNKWKSIGTKMNTPTPFFCWHPPTLLRYGLEHLIPQLIGIGVRKFF